MSRKDEGRENAMHSVKVREENFLKLWKLKRDRKVSGLDDVFTILLELYEKKNGPIKVE